MKIILWAVLIIFLIGLLVVILLRSCHVHCFI
ncbi:membrane protein [Shigella sonnei]|nr:membrane protein [Shigella sonnei]